MHPPASSRFPEPMLARRALRRSRRYPFWLMLLGAALEIVAAVVAVKTANSLVPMFARHDPGDANVIAVAHGQTLLLLDMVAAAFWLVMAFLNRFTRGDGPRIFSVVLFCMGTKLSWQYIHELNSRATQVVTVAIWLVGLAAITLLFSDKLSRFLRATFRRMRHARSRTANP
jgi:hypothetical protein